MPTTNPFTKKISIPDLISPGQSVGAHLAAKLDSFFSDERTLTDELCDMLCIWLTSPHTSRIIVPSPYVFDLFLTKTTPNEEIEIGADLELFVSSPLGKKRCLFQAKVLDPTSRKLRCDSTRGWEKLRTQLANAKKSAGDLSFLLIYVPGRMLNGRYYGFPTYEQGYLSNPPNNTKEAFYGVTVIPVNLLIDGYDQWISNVDKVKHDGNGGFRHGIALWMNQRLPVSEGLLSRQRESMSLDGNLFKKEVSNFCPMILTMELNKPVSFNPNDT